MMNFRYPTAAEMRALEFAARRARAREVGRLIGVAAMTLKSAGKRMFSFFTGKRMRHA